SDFRFFEPLKRCLEGMISLYYLQYDPFFSLGSLEFNALFADLSLSNFGFTLSSFVEIPSQAYLCNEIALIRKSIRIALKTGVSTYIEVRPYSGFRFELSSISCCQHREVECLYFLTPGQSLCY